MSRNTDADGRFCEIVWKAGCDLQGHAYNTDVPDIEMYRRALFTYISTHVICLKRSSPKDSHPAKRNLAQQTEATVSLGETRSTNVAQCDSAMRIKYSY